MIRAPRISTPEGTRSDIKKFPQASFSITSDVNFEKIKNSICDEFPDIICDTFSNWPMEGPQWRLIWPPMQNHIKF